MNSKTNETFFKQEETTKIKEEKKCDNNQSKVSIIKKLIRNKKGSNINPFHSVNLNKRQKGKKKTAEPNNIDKKKIENILISDLTNFEKSPIENILFDNQKEKSGLELKSNFESSLISKEIQDSIKSVQQNDLLRENDNSLKIKNVLSFKNYFYIISSKNFFLY